MVNAEAGSDKCLGSSGTRSHPVPVQPVERRSSYNRRVKIGIDARALAGERTGIGVYTENVARGLARLDGNRVALFTPRPIERPPAMPEAVSLHAGRRGPGTQWLHARLPAALQREGCEVLLAALTIAPARSPVPTVPVVHDLTPLTHPEWHRRRTVTAFLPWIEKTIGRASRLIAVSRATARELEALFPESRGRVDVVENGVDERFRAGGDDSSRREVRRIYSQGRPFILYLGTLEPRKNVLRLVGACERLWRKRRAWPDLMLAGGAGWKSGPLLARIGRSPFRDKIHRVGYVPPSAAPDLYRSAEVFCYPSLAEGFGLPVLEAMACGVPAVVSTAPALLEIAGEAALSAPAEDEEALAAALERLLEDPPLRAELSARGLRRAAQYPWGECARKTAGALTAACAAG
jgi:glycosyltransferase involved in cell wall biosynthesis